MEIVFGQVNKDNETALIAQERTTALVTEVEKRKLAVRANAFNDHELVTSAHDSSDSSGQLTLSPLVRSEPVVTGALCSRGLHCVPNAVLLLETLTTLDLRGNLLVELPDAIAQLSRLEVLDVSQNALVALPSTLAQLTALRVLNVAHNNVSAIPATLWVHLTHLQELDLSANVITHLPAPPLARLEHLHVLRFSDNVLSSENVAQLQTLVRAARVLKDAAVDNAVLQEPVTERPAPEETKGGRETAPGEAPEHDSNDAPTPDESTKGGIVPTAATATEDEPEDSELPMQAPDDDEAEDADEEKGEEEEKDAQDASEEEGEVVEDAAAASPEQSEQADRTPQDITPDTSASVVDVPRPVDAAGRRDGEGHAVAATVKSGAETHGSSAADDRAVRLHAQAEPSRDAHATEVMGTAAHAADVLAPKAPALVDLTIFSGANHLSDSLETSINENRASRAHVKQHNPALWRQYVARQVRFRSDLGNCVLCDAPNAGWNQRLNTMVLCPSCLQCAVDVIQTRAPPSSSSSSSRQLSLRSDESKASEPTDMES